MAPGSVSCGGLHWSKLFCLLCQISLILLPGTSELALASFCILLAKLSHVAEPGFRNLTIFLHMRVLKDYMANDAETEK